MAAERTGSFYSVKMTVGDIYTASGHQLYLDGTAGGLSGDGGPAVKAVLYDPCGIAPFGTGFAVLDDWHYRARCVRRPASVRAGRKQPRRWAFAAFHDRGPESALWQTWAALRPNAGSGERDQLARGRTG